MSRFSPEFLTKLVAKLDDELTYPLVAAVLDTLHKEGHLAVPSAVNLSPTVYGAWVRARLKERLDPELFDEIEEVTIYEMWSMYRMVAAVKKKGRKEPFRLACGFNSIYDKNANRLSLPEDVLARLILFLQ